MPSTRETILAALHTRLSALPATALRGEVLPERVPATGLLILRDGEPGEPEVTLSPLRYHYLHRAEIEAVVQGAIRDAAFDTLCASIGTALAADRTLGDRHRRRHGDAVPAGEALQLRRAVLDAGHREARRWQRHHRLERHPATLRLRPQIFPAWAILQPWHFRADPAQSSQLFLTHFPLAEAPDDRPPSPVAASRTPDHRARPRHAGASALRRQRSPERPLRIPHRGAGNPSRPRFRRPDRHPCHRRDRDPHRPATL